MAKWIRFIVYEQKPKTTVWRIESIENGVILGYVKWFPNWRKYAFFPEEDTVYEQDCLKDIANFIEIQMKCRKDKKCANGEKPK